MDNLSGGVTEVTGAIPSGGGTHFVYRSMNFGLNTFRVRHNDGGTTYFETFNQDTKIFEPMGQVTGITGGLRNIGAAVLLPDLFSCSP